MRFLLDANMPRSAAAVLQAAGHEPLDVRDLGMRKAADSEIAAYARAHRLALVTRDFDFADVRNYMPADYSGILVLDLPDSATARDVCQVLGQFLARPLLPEQLPGRLAIVDAQRVRFRPRIDSPQEP